jgi:hypothetical protein
MCLCTRDTSGHSERYARDCNTAVAYAIRKCTPVDAMLTGGYSQPSCREGWRRTSDHHPINGPRFTHLCLGLMPCQGMGRIRIEVMATRRCVCDGNLQVCVCVCDCVCVCVGLRVCMCGIACVYVWDCVCMCVIACVCLCTVTAHEVFNCWEQNGMSVW